MSARLQEVDALTRRLDKALSIGVALYKTQDIGPKVKQGKQHQQRHHPVTWRRGEGRPIPVRQTENRHDDEKRQREDAPYYTNVKNSIDQRITEADALLTKILNSELIDGRLITAEYVRQLRQDFLVNVWHKITSEVSTNVPRDITKSKDDLIDILDRATSAVKNPRYIKTARRKLLQDAEKELTAILRRAYSLRSRVRAGDLMDNGEYIDIHLDMFRWREIIKQVDFRSTDLEELYETTVDLVQGIYRILAVVQEEHAQARRNQSQTTPPTAVFHAENEVEPQEPSVDEEALVDEDALANEDSFEQKLEMSIRKATETSELTDIRELGTTRQSARSEEQREQNKRDCDARINANMRPIFNALTRVASLLEGLILNDGQLGSHARTATLQLPDVIGDAVVRVSYNDDTSRFWFSIHFNTVDARKIEAFMAATKVKSWACLARYMNWVWERLTQEEKGRVKHLQLRAEDVQPSAPQTVRSRPRSRANTNGRRAPSAPSASSSNGAPSASSSNGAQRWSVASDEEMSDSSDVYDDKTNDPDWEN